MKNEFQKCISFYCSLFWIILKFKISQNYFEANLKEIRIHSYINIFFLLIW